MKHFVIFLLLFLLLNITPLSADEKGAPVTAAFISLAAMTLSYTQNEWKQQSGVFHWITSGPLFFRGKELESIGSTLCTYVTDLSGWQCSNPLGNTQVKFSPSLDFDLIHSRDQSVSIHFGTASVTPNTEPLLPQDSDEVAKEIIADFQEQRQLREKYMNLLNLTSSYDEDANDDEKQRSTTITMKEHLGYTLTYVHEDEGDDGEDGINWFLTSDKAPEATRQFKKQTERHKKPEDAAPEFMEVKLRPDICIQYIPSNATTETAIHNDPASPTNSESRDPTDQGSGKEHTSEHNADEQPEASQEECDGATSSALITVEHKRSSSCQPDFPQTGIAVKTKSDESSRELVANALISLTQGIPDSGYKSVSASFSYPPGASYQQTFDHNQQGSSCPPGYSLYTPNPNEVGTRLPPCPEAVSMLYPWTSTDLYNPYTQGPQYSSLPGPDTKPAISASTGKVRTRGEPSICLVCGKSYVRPSTLKAHMRTHTGEKPYSCSICNKRFGQTAGLVSHQRTHSGDKPYKCPICNKGFSQSGSVTTHLRTHSGERPFRCDICGKGFADSSSKKKHNRVHTGERPYRCMVCGDKFSQSGNLYRHMTTHAEDQRNQFETVETSTAVAIKSEPGTSQTPPCLPPSCSYTAYSQQAPTTVGAIGTFGTFGPDGIYYPDGYWDYGGEFHHLGSYQDGYYYTDSGWYAPSNNFEFHAYDSSGYGGYGSSGTQ